MLWLLSYLGSHLGITLAYIIAIIVLGIFAWFLRNWKIAAVALALIAAYLGVMAVDRDAYQRRVNEEAQAQVKLLNNRISTLEQVKAAYTKRFAEDHAHITELEKLASETPKNDSPCLDADAARRVRAIR